MQSRKRTCAVEFEGLNYHGKVSSNFYSSESSPHTVSIALLLCPMIWPFITTNTRPFNLIFGSLRTYAIIQLSKVVIIRYSVQRQFSGFCNYQLSNFNLLRHKAPWNISFPSLNIPFDLTSTTYLKSQVFILLFSCRS